MAYTYVILLKSFSLFLWLTGGYSQRCPHDWKDRPGGNSCYFFGVGIPRKSWFSAQKFCQSSQADLLKMNDVEEKDWIIGEIAQLDKAFPGPQEFWVGLNARDNATVWKWADGEVADMKLVRWGSGEPSDPVLEQCAEIWDNLFNDKDCRTPIEFVCERSKDIPLTCDIDLGWQYYGGSCYKFKPAYRTFLQAREECQKQEADLVSVMSEEVQKTVNHLAIINDKQDSWIGINMYEKKWEFVNGSLFTPLTKTYWQPSANISPDSATESCVAVNASAKGDLSWYTDTCTNGKSFTCVKPEGVCDPSYDQHQSRCFQLVYTNKTWRQAYDYCGERGAHLVDIRKSSDQQFLRSYLNKAAGEITKVWIGLSRKENDPWTWTLNEFDQPTYFNWATGDDSRTSSDGACVYMDAGDRTGKWRSDTPCSQSAAFVCVTGVRTSKQETTTQNIVRTVALRTESAGEVSPAMRTVIPMTTTVSSTPYVMPKSIKCGSWEEVPHSDYCYKFNERKTTWSKADKNCVLDGGRLLSITSMQEQYYLAGRIRGMTSGSLWIGANSRGDSRGWHWSDGSPFKYIHWLPGQPDNVGDSEECVVMSERTARWSDEDCDQTHSYICKKLGIVTVTPPPVPTAVVIPDGQIYGCPESWMSYLDSCFLVSRLKKTWLEAKKVCSQEGGHLSSIRNEDEQNYLLSQLPKSHCYNIYTNDTQCTKWADIGECSKNPIWMSRNCHLSCKLCIKDCRDTYKGEEPFCRRWAESGECNKNPSWMSKNCAFSCGICDSAIYGGFWIGLNDRSFQYSFIWDDGSEVEFTTWMENEPNNYGTRMEDCVSMNLRTGKWSDVNCDRTLPGFICRKPKQLMPKTSISPLAVGCFNDSVGYSAACYQFNSDPLSFNDSESYCQTFGGHLATINNRYVQAFVSSQLVNKDNDYWIGLSDELTPGILSSWTSGARVEFTHWTRGYSGEDKSMCVHVLTTHPVGLWSKSNCTSEKKFICEYPRQGFTTTTTTTLPTPTSAPPTCASGWREAAGYCFKAFVKPKRTWFEARDYCREVGGDLASIHNMAEGLVVYRIMQSTWSTYWIGINDRDEEGGFAWSDNTPVDYVRWTRGEPNNMYNNQDCGQAMSWSHLWDDNTCYVKQPFVCKIKKGIDVLQMNDTTEELSLCGEDEDWMYHNGFCYYMYDKTIAGGDFQTWYEARDYCQKNGSDLVSVHSMDEANFLLTLITSSSNLYSSRWIGLNEIDLKHGYRWSDGTPLDFIHWSNREPSDKTGGERCVILMHGRWHDKNCNSKHSGFICKKRNGTSNIPPLPSLPPTPLIPAGCPPNFLSTPVSNKCFHFVPNTKLDWFSAKTECTRLGKGIQLASISNDLEMKFLVILMKDQTLAYSYWIGLYEDTAKRGHYMWEDNSQVEYVNWAPNEPNGGYERCVEMYGPGKKNGLWNDAPCYSRKGYICQGERSPEFPIPTPPFSCPEGFRQFETSCYKLLEAAGSWDDVNNHCRILGGTIASITSVYEQTFIDYLTRSIRNKFFYIGLKRSSSPASSQTSPKPMSNFYWVDNWPVLFLNWAENKPSQTAGSDCVVVKNSTWMDAACGVNIPALCEINKAEPPTTPIPGICPPGTSSYNKKCYYVERTRTSWSYAKAKCRQRGMDLTSVANEGESNFVLGLIGRSQRIRMWIGLFRTQDGSGFKWSDGTTLGYLSWNAGEPSDDFHSSGEMCVEMHEDGGWNDINCYNYNLLYVCKGDEMYITQPTTTEMSTTETTELETTETATTESPTTELPTTNQTATTETVPTVSVSQVSTQTPAITTDTNVTVPTTTKKTPQHYIPRRPSVLRKTNEKTSLSAGEIIGILIGIIGIITIAGAVYFVVKLHIDRSNTYNTKGHGFTNALYLKSGENVSLSEENNFAGSTVKLCEKSV